MGSGRSRIRPPAAFSSPLEPDYSSKSPESVLESVFICESWQPIVQNDLRFERPRLNFLAPKLAESIDALKSAQVEADKPQGDVKKHS